MGMTTGVGLLGVKFLDPQPDISSKAWDRRFLTIMVMLPSPSNFRGWTYVGWLSQWWRPHQEAVPFSLAPLPGRVGYQFQVDRLTCNKTYPIGQ